MLMNNSVSSSFRYFIVIVNVQITAQFHTTDFVVNLMTASIIQQLAVADDQYNK